MRKSDQSSPSVFRSNDRFFRVGDEWWCTTREGNLGPYTSRDQAERELRRYVDTMEFFEDRDARVDIKDNTPPPGNPKIWNNQIDVL